MEIKKKILQIEKVSKENFRKDIHVMLSSVVGVRVLQIDLGENEHVYIVPKEIFNKLGSDKVIGEKGVVNEDTADK